MSRLLAATLSLGLALTLGACASDPVDSNASNGSSRPTPTPNQELVPELPVSPLIEVDPVLYDDGFGWFSFKVGDGPTWCTISPAIDGDNSGGNVICEQNEAAALYKPIPIPASCDYSFGYQVRLMGVPGAVEGTDTASFTCASGFYADPSEAPILAAGQRITVAPFKCFVEDVNVRCENETGQYIALGPKVWALGN